MLSEKEKNIDNIDLSSNIKLTLTHTRDQKDFIAPNQDTQSIGRGGSGNVAMARDNYTKEEIEAHDELLELIGA